jgi:hypothetical protein
MFHHAIPLDADSDAGDEAKFQEFKRWMNAKTPRTPRSEGEKEILATEAQQGTEKSKIKCGHEATKGSRRIHEGNTKETFS